MPNLNGHEDEPPLGGLRNSELVIQVVEGTTLKFCMLGVFLLTAVAKERKKSPQNRGLQGADFLRASEMIGAATNNQVRIMGITIPGAGQTHGIWPSVYLNVTPVSVENYTQVDGTQLPSATDIARRDECTLQVDSRRHVALLEVAPRQRGRKITGVFLGIAGMLAGFSVDYLSEELLLWAYRELNNQHLYPTAAVATAYELTRGVGGCTEYVFFLEKDRN